MDDEEMDFGAMLPQEHDEPDDMSTAGFGMPPEDEDIFADPDETAACQPAQETPRRKMPTQAIACMEISSHKTVEIKKKEDQGQTEPKVSDDAGCKGSPKAASQCVKKRRLTTKTSPEGTGFELAAVGQHCILPLIVGSHSEETIPYTKAEWWEEKHERQKYDYVYNKLRRAGLYQQFMIKYEQTRKKTAIEWPAKWIDLELKRKQAFVELWAHEAQGELSAVRKWAVESMLLPKSKPGYKNKGATQLLLTYQGKWGELDWQSSKPLCEISLNDMVEILRGRPYLQRLWDRVKDEAEQLKATTWANDVAVSLELCPETFIKGKLRVHVHLALKRVDRLWYRSQEDLELLGSKPHITLASGGSRKRARFTDWSAFYYVVCPKIGSILTHSSQRAFKDLLVNPEWVWHLLQQHKMELTVARDEIIRTSKNTKRHLENLDILEKELSARSLRVEIKEKETQIAQVRSAFRVLPEVTSWLHVLTVVADRRKFLVLDGPSRMGKTAFTVSLVPAGRALEVNCANVEYPPLRGFRTSAHSLVLFDEGSMSMVLGNRRLNQSPNVPVAIGISPTNMCAYDVYLNNVALVVCTNS